MSILLELSHDERDIQFLNKEHEIIGFTSYKEEIFSELIKVKWRVNERDVRENKKTYIYTGSNHFGPRKDLHQVVMKLWYGNDILEEAYKNNFIIEHHNNQAFDCRIQNLSFASKDLNLTKAHSFDKNQPKLVMQAGVNFYKDFDSQQFQITVIFTEDYFISVEDQTKLIDSLYFLYDDNFRLVYTDANRIVDELLENRKIELRLLSPKKIWYQEAIFFSHKNGEDVSGINFVKDDFGNHFIVVGNDAKGKFVANSIPPNFDLFKKN